MKYALLLTRGAWQEDGDEMEQAGCSPRSASGSPDSGRTAR